MLRPINLSGDFYSEVAEKVIAILKSNLGNGLEIFIMHRSSDKTTNLVFDYEKLMYSIKIYEEDDLIFCGIEQFKYKNQVINDQDLFLLIGERNVLSVAEATVENFILNIRKNKYSYVKPILKNLIKLNSCIDFNEKSNKEFFEKSIKYFFQKAIIGENTTN